VIWYVSPLPWLLPGSVVSLVVALIGSGPVGRWLGVRRIVAWAMLLTLGVILSGTLSPLEKEFQRSAAPRTCDISRLGPPPLSALLDPTTDVAANILLFVPLGFAVGLVPASRRKLALVLASLALPVAIESVQLLVTPLNRGCESADVVDNLTGLAIGLVVGTALRRYVPWVRREVEPVD
jgi:glycopeptide antibiotics resistance protein